MMNYITEKLRTFISGPQPNHLNNQNHPFDFIKSKTGITRELQISKDSGNLLGLFSPISEGMLLVVALNIEARGEEEIVVFQKYDFSGRVLSTMRISVKDIMAICPFVKGRQRTVLIQ